MNRQDALQWPDIEAISLVNYLAANFFLGFCTLLPAGHSVISTRN